MSVYKYVVFSFQCSARQSNYYETLVVRYFIYYKMIVRAVSCFGVEGDSVPIGEVGVVVDHIGSICLLLLHC